jgi:glucose/arabinose dehydrogenase
MRIRLTALALAAAVVAPAAMAQAPATPPKPFPVQPPPPPYHPPAPGQPVELKPPNAKEQPPAFKEQTRAPYTPSSVKFEVKTVAEGLYEPWGLAFLPDGRMLVTERPGNIRIVSKDGSLSPPVAGTPPVHIQQISGMQDVVLDPHYASNHLIYWTFVEGRPGLPNGTGVAVARARLVDGAPPRVEDVKIIYRQEPDRATEHSNYGGRMLFDRDGYLLVTLGDRDGMPERPFIQKTDNGIGKVVRITTDGAPAPDGPFAKTAGALPELWALGLRNPLGITARPGTRELWVSDVGPKGGDEIDILKPGANYGWPVIGYGTEYSGDRIGVGTQQAGMEQPVYFWDPVISPSSVMFYSGALFPAWKGNAFVTSLTQRRLVRLVLKGDKVVGEDPLVYDLGERLREAVQGPDGAIYLITDNEKGRILKLVPAG